MPTVTNVTLEVARDDAGLPFPALAPKSSSDVGYTDTNIQTAVLAGKVVRLVAGTDCRVSFGDSPVALATSMLVKANQVEYFRIKTTDKLAVIQDSAPGSLNVTVME